VAEMSRLFCVCCFYILRYISEAFANYLAQTSGVKDVYESF
jgi:hypothetical protein